MTTALKARSGKLLRVPSNELSIGCPTTGTCCNWPPPTPTTMGLRLTGFLSYGVETCLYRSDQICAGTVSSKVESFHSNVNGSYSTTAITILPGDRVIGAFTLSNGTYANPGVLIRKTTNYGQPPVAACGAVASIFEDYLVRIDTAVLCRSSSDCSGLGCGRRIDVVNMTFQRWNTTSTPIKVSPPGVSFGLTFDLSLVCGNTFVHSSTTKSSTQQTLEQGCLLFHTIIQNPSATITI